MLYKPPNAHQRALRFRSSVCHITGLPFYAPNFDTSGDRAWSKVNAGTMDYMTFGNTLYMRSDAADPKVASPSFKIPDDTNVSLYVKYTKNTNSYLSEYIFRVKLYNGDEGSELVKHSSKKKGTYEFNNNSVTLSSTWNRMLCWYRTT